MGRTMPTACEHDVVIDWGDFGGDDPPEECPDCEARWAAQRNTSRSARAAALQCATTWRPWTPGQPERDAIAGLFETASVFAAWIESGEQQ